MNIVDKPTFHGPEEEIRLDQGTMSNRFLGRGDCSWKASFSGSTLVFWGVRFPCLAFQGVWYWKMQLGLKKGDGAWWWFHPPGKNMDWNRTTMPHFFGIVDGFESSVSFSALFFCGKSLWILEDRFTCCLRKLGSTPCFRVSSMGPSLLNGSGIIELCCRWLRKF